MAGNQQDNFNAAQSVKEAAKEREAYVKSMEAKGQKPKDIRDM